MVLQEHLGCPKCGYDLHGIDEVRCPECGFGYDADALRSMAESEDGMRLAAARSMVLRATIAATLAVPAVCDRFGISGWTRFWLVVVAYMAAFLSWIVVTDADAGMVSVPGLFRRFVLFALLMRFVLRYVPLVAFVCSVVALSLAWYVRICNWPPLSPRENLRLPSWRRRIDRYSLVGNLILALATILVLIVSIP